MKPGDVILLRTHGLRAAINTAAQSLATLKKARFSHALLCVSPSVLIDATPAAGIALRNVAREVISEHLTDAMCQDGRIQVWRPPAGCWTIKPGRPFVSALAHMAKDYNWRFLQFQESDIDPTSQDSTSAFCSELVAIMLKQWKVLPKSARRSSKTLPVHLQQLQRLKWTDVTNEWKDVFRDIREWSESSDLNACKNAGLALYQGNQQIALLNALKTVQLNVRRH
jgi:hypothetical protein